MMIRGHLPSTTLGPTRRIWMQDQRLCHFWMLKPAVDKERTELASS